MAAAVAAAASVLAYVARQIAHFLISHLSHKPHGLAYRLNELHRAIITATILVSSGLGRAISHVCVCP